MEVSQRIAVSGMLASQRQLDVVSNNLANVNSTGFKRGMAHTTDVGYQAGLDAPVGPGGASIRITGIGQGTQLADVNHDFLPGALQGTGNPLDIALQGDGFFSMRLPDGQLGYSRDGSLTIDAGGRLVTSGGQPVQSDTGTDLTLPPDSVDVHIDDIGQLMASGQPVGKLGLAVFPNNKGLLAQGQNTWTATAASGAPVPVAQGTANAPIVVAGALEGSNVDVGDEFMRLIQAQRGYELSSKVVQAWDDVERMANDLRRA